MTQPTGFAMTPRWLVEDPTVSDRAARLFAILSGRIRRDGIRLTRAEIAETMGCSTSTAKRALRELRDLGVLVSDEPGGDNEGAFYSLAIDARGIDSTPGHQRPDPRVISDPTPGSPLTLLPSYTDVGRHTPTPRSARVAFDDFWSLYPRRVGKAAAEKAWTRAIKRERPETIVERLRERLDVIEAQNRPEGDYRPHPATWLNQGRWDDEIPRGSKRPRSAWDRAVDIT